MRADPWMEALEKKSEAHRTLEAVHRLYLDFRKIAVPGSREWQKMESLAVVAEYDHDLEVLPKVDSYAWFDPAQEAVWQASKTVPTDVPLRDLKTPGSPAGGWWWFTRPLPVRTVDPADVPVGALLWYWVTPDMLRFSVYVVGSELSEDMSTVTKGGGNHPYPSAQWHWHIDHTLEQTLEEGKRVYLKAYGPGGRWYSSTHGMTKTKDGTPLIGMEKTIHAVETISRFFFAACVWLDQKIVTADPGHVERHARKRIQKELKLKEPPAVKIIALRHTERGHREGASTTPDGGRTWNCQWVVSGHWRKQPYGPGRMGRRLTFIHPFVKGPEDKPLRPKPDKLFVVLK